MGPLRGPLVRPSREENETDFQNDHRACCGTVHACAFCDDGARRSRRRLLHHERRPCSSWLRLSDHGGMPGGVLRHRRHMRALSLRPIAQRCPRPCAKAGPPAKRVSSGEETSGLLSGRTAFMKSYVSNGAASEVGLQRPRAVNRQLRWAGDGSIAT